MITFLSLWETIHGDDPPLENIGGDSRAVQAIRAGLNIRGEDHSRTFWDDFIQVCNNGDAMAELLEVRPDQISKWTGRIRDMVDRVRKEEDGNSTKNNVIPTGIS